MEKINVAELLKDCPKGMELDCTMFDDVTFLEVIDRPNYQFPIKIAIGANRFRSLTETGGYDLIPETKCVIFPKGKTTWEGFVPPCKFKDGDILATDIGSIFILKEPDEYVLYYSCYVALTDVSHIITSRIPFCAKSRCRLATEDEKRKLFDAIKANGYKWNGETKTLEKLVEPKFKVGDKVWHKNNHNVIFTITSIEEDYYGCGAAKAFWFEDQDYYELVPYKFDITTLVPFESRVLVRDKNTDEWRGHFFSHYDNNSGTPYICIGLEGINEYRQCIPYEENEFLLGKTDDCDEFYKNW